MLSPLPSSFEVKIHKKVVKRAVLEILNDPEFDLHAKSIKHVRRRVEKAMSLPKGSLSSDKWMQKMKDVVDKFSIGLIEADEQESQLIALSNHLAAPATSTKFSKLETERVLGIANDYIETNGLNKEDFVRELQLEVRLFPFFRK